MSDQPKESTAAKRGLFKKALMVLLAATLLAGAGGGGAWYAVAKLSPDAQPATAPVRPGEPSFLALDPFTVNLADKGQERYAQIGVTLELSDRKFEPELRKLMPVIRDRLLMVLAHQQSDELMTRDGKERLAAEIMREAVQPLGIELDAQGQALSAGQPAINPLRQVLFSNIIIQ